MGAQFDVTTTNGYIDAIEDAELLRIFSDQRENPLNPPA